MINGNRETVFLDLLQTSNGQDPVVTFGEPLVQMTTPQVALNCLIYCPPSGI